MINKETSTSHAQAHRSSIAAALSRVAAASTLLDLACLSNLSIAAGFCDCNVVTNVGGLIDRELPIVKHNSCAVSRICAK